MASPARASSPVRALGEALIVTSLMAVVVLATLTIIDEKVPFLGLPLTSKATLLAPAATPPVATPPVAAPAVATPETTAEPASPAAPAVAR